MLGGTVVIESVFSIPGIGMYTTSAINNRDYPIVMGGVLFLGAVFSLIMLLVDIIYAYVVQRTSTDRRRAEKLEKEEKIMQAVQLLQEHAAKTRKKKESQFSLVMKRSS